MTIIPFLKTKVVTLFHSHHHHHHHHGHGRSRLNYNAHISRFEHTQTMPIPLKSTSNLNLRASCTKDQLKEALHILLTTHTPPVNSSAYFQLLQTCIANNALSHGTQIHSLITHRKFPFVTSTLFQNKLIDMYVKCGSLANARKVFDDMKKRSVSSWNTIIAAYRRDGFPQEALALFHQMQRAGVEPDHFAFATILPACAKIRDLEQGVGFHQSIIERGFSSDIVVASALLDMYAKCGSIDKARELFDNMPDKNVISWNAMIAGYAQNGYLDEALKIFKEMPERNAVSWNAVVAGYAQNGFVESAMEAFKQMRLAGIKPDRATFASILPACAEMRTLEKGMGLHESIIEFGFLSDVVVANALIDMYAKCGRVQKARRVFNKMPKKNVVSWTAIIAGYAQNGVMEEASRLFTEMPQPDLISWNTIIAGYAVNGFAEKALEAFKQMHLAGVEPNSTAFANILPACAKMGALEQGIDIHQIVIECGLSSDVLVVNALIDMYAKCGSLQKAHVLFEKMPQRDVISWTAMIAGYAQNGVPGEALRLFKEIPQPDVISWTAMIAGFVQNGFAEEAIAFFKKMQLTGVKPDSTTFASILPACAKIGALEQGMDIHQSIMESGHLSHTTVANALVDMYAKCGSIHKAREQFDKMPQRDVVSWNAMVGGYAQNGFCKDALKIFELMKHSGTQPDHVSFTCVLLACSHAGLVDEGCKYFNGISVSHCTIPILDHYVCMVDLLGRASYLEESLKFIIKMPIKPVVVVWMCLLGVCRSYKNIRLGVFSATLLFELDPKNTATYVLLSNIYADVGKWAEVQMIRKLMKDKGITKTPGCSWIGDHEVVHAFCVEERSHPQAL